MKFLQGFSFIFLLLCLSASILANTFTQELLKVDNIDVSSTARNGHSDRTQMNLELLQSRWDLSLKMQPGYKGRVCTGDKKEIKTEPLNRNCL